MTSATVLKCHCLNITLHVQGSWPGTRVDAERFREPSAKEHGFFQGQLIEMEVDFEGLVMALSSIVRQETVGDLRVFTCGACGIHTHGVHQHKAGRVLVNPTLKSKASEFEAIRNSPQFSSVYGILLPSFPTLPDISRLQQTHGSGMLQAQQVLDLYLVREHAAVEERIKQFADEQRATLIKLRHRSQQDLQAVYHAMADVNSSKSESTDQERSPGTLSPAFVTDRPENMSIFRTAHGAKSHLEEHDSDFGMFSMDDDPLAIEDEPNKPFFVSDEEDDSSADNSWRERNVPGLQIRTNPVASSGTRTEIAASLPVQMPGRLLLSHSTQPEREDAETPAMEHMGQSIKALAKSVNDQSTDVFGDLPQPITLTRSFMSSFS